MEDHRLAALPVALALLAVTVPVGGCGKGSLAGDSGSPVAGDAGTLMACDDGTAEQDCCPGSVASGVACAAAGPVQCWTRCTSGYRGQFVCSDGTWLAGHGLFPCAADASTDALDASDMAHGCRPGSADCGPVGTWSCTPQHACCMGGGSGDADGEARPCGRDRRGQLEARRARRPRLRSDSRPRRARPERGALPSASPAFAAHSSEGWALAGAVCANTIAIDKDNEMPTSTGMNLGLTMRPSRVCPSPSR